MSTLSETFLKSDMSMMSSEEDSHKEKQKHKSKPEISLRPVATLCLSTAQSVSLDC